MEIKAGGDITIPSENEYEFTNNLANSNPNGIALQAVGTINIFNDGDYGTYSFEGSDGLIFDTQSVQENYSIEMEVLYEYDERFVSPNKLLDFKNRTRNDGLYLIGGSISFPGATGLGDSGLTSGQLHRIVLQRSQGIVTIYLDGEKQFAFADNDSIATYERLHIFLDDVQTVNSVLPGTADSLHITQREFYVGDDLTLEAGGNVDTSSAILSIPGNLSIKADDVKIVATSDVKLADAFVHGDTEISTVGRIIQTSPALRFTGTSSFNASGNINLGRPDNNFVGAMSATGQNVVLSDATHIRLDAVKAGTSVVIDAGGYTTNTANAIVLGLRGDFFADEIRLGNRTGDDVRFNVTTLDSQSRTEYYSDQSIRLLNLSAASSLVASTVSIFDSATATIDAEFNAKFTAPRSISLGDTNTDSVTTGQVTLQSDGYVGFAEDGDARFVGNSIGQFLFVSADGALTDTDAATINARNGLRIEAASVRLGDAESNKFKASATTLQIRGDAFLRQLTNVLMTGNSVIDGDLTLASEAQVLDTFSSFLTVPGHMHVEGNRIYIGDSLTSHLSAKSFSFDSNTSATVLFSGMSNFGGSSQANDAFVFTNGALGSLDSASLNVSGRTKLQATSIQIGKKVQDDFRSTQIEFVSRGRADMEFDRGVVIAGTNEATSLRIATPFFITDADYSILEVQGHSRFIGTSIAIGEKSTDLFETGSLSFAATGSVTFHEDNNMRLYGTSSANRLNLKSPGSITDDQNSEVVIAESATLRGVDLIIGELATDCFDIAAGPSGLATFGTNVNVTLG
ncbi:hypothetical protein [Mariniblastus fucicola]|uniref:Autotransporter-associated beta strand repeat protein n=1 Tax=Mariniblastus fucicola TaxID=980251 RepID=A0A5B9PE65_9BACT|nr:hypothetical protein [Mariniblastus fucicola]QEG23440.1 hypothetical protein MFFC18_33390 [Mariniblastus fucicola]